MGRAPYAARLRLQFRCKGAIAFRGMRTVGVEQGELVRSLQQCLMLVLAMDFDQGLR